MRPIPRLVQNRHETRNQVRLVAVSHVTAGICASGSRAGVQRVVRARLFAGGGMRAVLRIHYGPMDGVIYNTAVYFRNVYRDEWLEDDFAKRVIRAVDKSEVVGPHLIESRVLGPIPPEGLSGGVKTLLLINFMPDKVFNASTCGDNCAHWLLAIGRKQDVTINLRHILADNGLADSSGGCNARLPGRALRLVDQLHERLARPREPERPPRPVAGLLTDGVGVDLRARAQVGPPREALARGAACALVRAAPPGRTRAAGAGPHAGRRAGLPVPRGAGAGCRLSSASAARVKFVPPETSSRCFLLRASCISLGFP